jgi:tripartite-type tricarboxylate transporter receptor subunit TctC
MRQPAPGSGKTRQADRPQPDAQRRAGLIAAAALALCLGSAALAPAVAQPAQPWPQRPVRIVVPFDAGGIADITARLLAERMSQSLSQQVVVENRPGAGGVAATELVIKAPADGHVLLLISNGSAVSASLFRSLPFDIQRDVEPISTLGFFDIVLVTRGDGGHATLADLVADARSRPGRLNAGTISIGSTQNLAAELFKSVARVDLQTVPFKSTSAVVSALRSGDVQVGFELLGPIYSQVRAGALRVLAVASDRRFPGLPNVPTAAEAGVPGYLASSWNGLAAPARTPRAVIDRIQQSMAGVLAQPDLRTRLAELGVEARASSPEGLRDLLGAEIVKWRGVIERANIERQ